MLTALCDGKAELPGDDDGDDDDDDDGGGDQATVVNPYSGTLFLPGDFDLLEDRHYDRMVGWF